MEGAVGHGPGQRGRGGLRFFVALARRKRRRRQQRLTAWGEPLGRGDGRPAAGCLLSARNLRQSRGGNRMRRGYSLPLTLACAMVLGSLIVSYTGVCPKTPRPQTPGPLDLQPYPLAFSGRFWYRRSTVRRESQRHFDEALKEWLALPPPTVTVNLHTPGHRIRAVQILGKLMNFDENMSPFQESGCSSCHMPYAGFSDRSRPSI